MGCGGSKQKNSRETQTPSHQPEGRGKKKRENSKATVYEDHSDWVPMTAENSFKHPDRDAEETHHEDKDAIHNSTSSARLKKMSTENGSWSFNMAQFGELKLFVLPIPPPPTPGVNDDLNSDGLTASTDQRFETSTNSSASPTVNPLAYVSVDLLSFMHPSANLVAGMEWSHHITKSKEKGNKVIIPPVKVPLYLRVSVLEDPAVVLVEPTGMGAKKKSVISPLSAATKKESLEEAPPAPRSDLGELAALIGAEMSDDSRSISEVHLVSGDDGFTWSSAMVKKEADSIPTEDMTAARRAIQQLVEQVGQEVSWMARGLKKPTVEGGCEEVALENEGDASPLSHATAAAPIELEPNDLFMEGIAKLFTGNQRRKFHHSNNKTPGWTHRHQASATHLSVSDTMTQ